MTVWILCNRAAGRGLSDAALRELVENAGHTVVALVDKQHLEAQPRPHGGVDLGTDLLVAAGGDGTVKAAARLAAGTSMPLAILPLGTANNIAASLGIEADLPKLISSWHRARRVPLDLGYARAGSKEWLMIEGAGGGWIPAGIAAAQRALESVAAPASAEIRTAAQVFYDVLETLEPARRTITIDDWQFSEELLMVEVLNIRSVGPNLVLAPDASPSDGLLDVILAGPAHRAELLEYLGSRIHNDDPRLSLPAYRARHVQIDSYEELHIDDERIDARGLGKIDISVAPGAVTLLM